MSCPIDCIKEFSAPGEIYFNIDKASINDNSILTYNLSFLFCINVVEGGLGIGDVVSYGVVGLESYVT